MDFIEFFKRKYIIYARGSHWICGDQLFAYTRKSSKRCVGAAHYAKFLETMRSALFIRPHALMQLRARVWIIQMYIIIPNSMKTYSSSRSSGYWSSVSEQSRIRNNTSINYTPLCAFFFYFAAFLSRSALFTSAASPLYSFTLNHSITFMIHDFSINILYCISALQAFYSLFSNISISSHYIGYTRSNTRLKGNDDKIL